MTKINNMHIEFNAVSTELGFCNQLYSVDTINNIIVIGTIPKIDYIPKSKIDEITLQIEKQVTQITKA
jgi:hypothetical protein